MNTGGLEAIRVVRSEPVFTIEAWLVTSTGETVVVVVVFAIASIAVAFEVDVVDSVGAAGTGRDGTRLVSTSYAQQLPNMNRSMHIPNGVPSDLTHSHTNMHLPSWPLTRHGFWLIWYPAVRLRENSQSAQKKTISRLLTHNIYYK